MLLYLDLVALLFIFYVLLLVQNEIEVRPTTGS